MCRLAIRLLWLLIPFAAVSAVSPQQAAACPWPEPSRCRDPDAACVSRGSLLELELYPDPLDVCVRAVLPDGRHAGVAGRPRVTLHDVRDGGRLAKTITTAPRHDGPGAITFCTTAPLTPGATYQVQIAGDDCRTDVLGEFTARTPIAEGAIAERPRGDARVGALVVAFALLAIVARRRRRLPAMVPA